MIFKTKCMRSHKDFASAAACEGDDDDDDDDDDDGDGFDAVIVHDRC